MIIYCYECDAVSPEHEDAEMPEGWGFVWGSDGVGPDGATACYACPEHADPEMS